MTITLTTNEGNSLDLEMLLAAFEFYFDRDVELKLGADSQGRMTATFTDEDGELDYRIVPSDNSLGGWLGYNAVKYDGGPDLGCSVGTTFFDVAEGMMTSLQDDERVFAKMVECFA
jgi:hypothetical protein